MINFQGLIKRTECSGMNIVDLARRVETKSTTPLDKIILGICGVAPLGIDDADYISNELNLSNEEYEDIFFAQ